MSGGITLLRVTNSESGKVTYLNGANRRLSGYYGLTGMKKAESSFDNSSYVRRYKPFPAATRSLQDLRINTNGSVLGQAPRIPPKDPFVSSKMKKPVPVAPVITTTAPVDTIYEDDITIPNDGCLFNFTADEMATFFRYMRVEDRFISHMHRKCVDGKRFSRMKDSEMESCGINNPVIKYFRDKSMKKTKGRNMPFLL